MITTGDPKFPLDGHQVRSITCRVPLYLLPAFPNFGVKLMPNLLIHLHFSNWNVDIMETNVGIDGSAVKTFADSRTVIDLDLERLTLFLHLSLFSAGW
jgi:hypothetical protein